MSNLPIEPTGGAPSSQALNQMRADRGEGTGAVQGADSTSAAGGSMTGIIAFCIDMASEISQYLGSYMIYGQLLEFLLQGADALFSALQNPSQLTGQEASQILNFLTFLDNVAASPAFGDLSSKTQSAITNLIDNTGIQQLQASLLSLYNYEEQNGLLNLPESQWTTAEQSQVDTMISTIEKTDIPAIQNSSSYDSLLMGLYNATEFLQASTTNWMVTAKLEMGKLAPLFQIPTNVINQSTQQESSEESRMTS